MHGYGECSVPAEQLTAQFMELPGLRLTLHQAARLLHIDRVMSEDVDRHAARRRIPPANAGRQRGASGPMKCRFQAPEVT